MWNDEQANSENLALDLQKIDHFTFLALWGAPWQKAWLELAMLEKRWDGNTICQMVDERISYPDYAAKVTKPYPQADWISDLLQEIKPSPLSSQFLSVNEADYLTENITECVLYDTTTNKYGPNHFAVFVKKQL